jgi:hypothetical protein
MPISVQYPTTLQRGYGIGDFNGDKYFEFLFMYWLLLWTCEAVAQVIPEFLFTSA